MVKVAAKTVPTFVAELMAALEKRIPASTTDAERVVGLDHYFWRVAVLSEHFSDMDFDDRHDLVWGIAREVVAEHRLRRISMILCLTPEELRGED